MNKISALTLRVPAYRVDAVVAYYRAEGVMEASGAASAQLLVADGDPGRITCIAHWTDVDGYARWQRDPRREVFSTGIAHAAAGQIVVHSEEFTVVHAC